MPSGGGVRQGGGVSESSDGINEAVERTVRTAVTIGAQLVEAGARVRATAATQSAARLEHSAATDLARLLADGALTAAADPVAGGAAQARAVAAVSFPTPATAGRTPGTRVHRRAPTSPTRSPARSGAAARGTAHGRH